MCPPSPPKGTIQPELTRRSAAQPVNITKPSNTVYVYSYAYRPTITRCMHGCLLAIFKSSLICSKAEDSFRLITKVQPSALIYVDALELLRVREALRKRTR